MNFSFRNHAVLCVTFIITIDMRENDHYQQLQANQRNFYFHHFYMTTNNQQQQCKTHDWVDFICVRGDRNSTSLNSIEIIMRLNTHFANLIVENINKQVDGKLNKSIVSYFACRRKNE